MRLLIALVASSALLVGCGGSDKPETKPSVEPEASETTEQGVDALCPRLESVVNTDDFADAAAWQSATAELDAIAQEGDSSVDQLVDQVRPGVESSLKYAQAGRPAGEGLDAFEGLTDARRVIAGSCP